MGFGCNQDCGLCWQGRDWGKYGPEVVLRWMEDLHAGGARSLIISGGENIYPRELEELLFKHPSVGEVAVVGLPDDRWGDVPVLVLVPLSGQRVDLAGLQALFNQRLARFKHPRRMLLRDALPRTALGKSPLFLLFPVVVGRDFLVVLAGIFVRLDPAAIILRYVLLCLAPG